jgi:hypothetical protein
MTEVILNIFVFGSKRAITRRASTSVKFFLSSAKAVLARQAKAANVATEAQALKFFANTNFIAIERACLTAKGKVEAAFENLKPIDTRKSFLGAPLKNRR